jgi:pimeloyl-ACP methyl ester carboxylesterase
MTTFNIFIVSLFASYILVVYLMQKFQGRMIFPGRRLPASFKWTFHSPFDEICIESQGLKLSSLLFKAENAKGTILYFHGNAGTLDMWGQVGIDLVRTTGWNVWVIDYPGYGLSQGRVESEVQIHQMAWDFYQKLISLPQALRGPGIVFDGRSIGSGIAARLALEVESKGMQVDALILETPYLSIKRLVGELLPVLPTWLIRFPLMTSDWIGKIKAPILLVHGKKDGLIPFSHSEDLLKLMKPTDRLLTLPLSDHNHVTAYPEYGQSVNDLLAKARSQ